MKAVLVMMILIVAAGCSHKVEVSTLDEKPLVIVMDVNVRLTTNGATP